MVFVYYDDKSIRMAVHAENNQYNPLCGEFSAAYNGEFLRSRHEYDRQKANEFALDMSVVTCKRCLKILNKKGK